MDKIVFKIVKNNLNVSIFNKDIKEELNNTNIINTKEIYFSINYIKDNLELVSSFFNVIIIKQNINKVIINDYETISITLDIIKYISSIKELIIKPNKILNYNMFLKILDNKYLNTIEAFDIPKYLLERLDLNKDLNINLRCEILFISNFMDSNNLNTYSDIYYKKNIVINSDFNENDINDIDTFFNINKYLKVIEFNYFNEENFNLILDKLLNNDKQNIKIIFNEKNLNINDIYKIVYEFKSKNSDLLEEKNITFKIDYSDEYKKNNIFKQINLNVIKVTLLSVILVVMLMMGINIYHNYKDNQQSNEIMKTLDSIIMNDTNQENNIKEEIEYIEPNSEEKSIINETTTTVYDIKYKMIFDELLTINDDTVGWLKVNNTNIDYPVVQSSDNNYYLKKDYYKNTNRHGWIFMDYRNNAETLNKNTIIYGHNLANQKMFGTLRYALNSSWYKKTSNQIITFNTINENMRFQIFSIYKIPVTTDYLTTNFSTNNEYETFINMIKERSIYDFKIEVTTNDKILTLSTCSNGSDQRLVVHAKLIIE